MSHGQIIFTKNYVTDSEFVAKREYFVKINNIKSKLEAEISDKYDAAAEKCRGSEF